MSLSGDSFWRGGGVSVGTSSADSGANGIDADADVAADVDDEGR